MTLHREVEAFFADPDASGVETVQEVDTDHGRLEDPHGQRQPRGGLGDRRPAGIRASPASPA